MNTEPVDEWAQNNGFGDYLEVPAIGRLSQLTPRKKRRAGIYLLYLSTGEVYIGQSQDVIRRLADHRRERSTLLGVRFRWTPKAGLGDLERQLIRDAETMGIPLTNVQGMVTLGHLVTEVEVCVSEIEQQRWLDDPATVNSADTAQRQENPTALRRQCEGRWSIFANRKDVAALRGVLRK